VRYTLRALTMWRESGSMATQDGMAAANSTTTEGEVAWLLIETLQLERSPEEIIPDAPLFGDGLGLDSIDALEIALALSCSYGFEIKSEEARAQQIFSSLRNLTKYINDHRKR
jgi:acyl carrier protein